MTERIPEFLIGATNVYRTREYIVKQCVAFSYDEVYGTVSDEPRYILSLYAEEKQRV